MSWTSALYVGDVVHRRHRPRKHSLRYSVFCFLLDLDELPALDRGLWLFGYNCRAAFRFDEADHGSGELGTLKAWVLDQAAGAGVVDEELSVEVLCYPRVLGYGFNPLTVYFCRRPGGEVVAVLYEVCNTFKERHTYVIPVTARMDRAIRHSCAKQMYVSPFMPMDCQYHFRIAPPADDVLVSIDEHDAEGSLLYASFAGKQRPISNASLFAVLLKYPLMTLKVIAAIHWEALRLWLKGIPVHRHEKAAARIAISTIGPLETSRSETP